MDKGEWIHRRKGRYMAQTLEAFEEQIEHLLPAEAAGAVQDFKGLVRARFNALAVDAVEVTSLDGVALNGYAQQIRDRISPTGRP